MVTLFNGADHVDYQGKLSFEGKKAVVEIASSRQEKTDSGLHTAIIQGLSRGDRIDFSIQKCTELGISRIGIFNARHTQNPLRKAQQEKRLSHWLGIAIKACEQCGRHRIPDIRFYSDLGSAIEHIDENGKKIMLDFDGPPLAGIICNHEAENPVSLLTGPEGGLSPEEKTLAKRQGFIPAKLGPRVLRTETAAMAGLTLIQSIHGDMAD